MKKRHILRNTGIISNAEQVGQLAGNIEEFHGAPDNRYSLDWPRAQLARATVLQSFLDHGHEVVLYTYDKVKGVPKGVKIANADDVLPSKKITRHARTGSPAYHADVFRLHMLKQTDYFWADTDAFCCQPWDIKKGKHFHGWISDNKPMVNNGVLRLPKTSKTLKAMLKFTSDEYSIPPWLPERKKSRTAGVKRQG